jgi:hypothetical protein
MKVKELKQLIQEAVKEATAEVLKEKHIGFDKLKRSLAHKKGVKNPGAVAAAIGRKKYGAKAMSKAAHTGHSLGEDALTFLEEANALYEKHIGFKNLVDKLRAKGLSDEKAKETAYHIGVKKYGKQKMSKAAAAHKPLKDSQALKESPPEGWHGTVAAMKQHHHTGKGKITNPYALAHYMANKGDKPHYKEQPTSKHGKPVKKKKGK